MGREAQCVCVWNGKTYNVKALLETSELIIRGELRKRVPSSTIKDVKVDKDELRFTVEGESVALSLSHAIATKWAETLLKPPPTLAKKLGISPETTVWMIGPLDDAALKVTLAEAKSISHRNGDLIVARVDTPADLNATLMRAGDQLSAGVPIWLIYRKGSGHPLNENLVRSTALAAGIVDTKVAAISTGFSALRFVRRRR